ncbi:MAG: hypothetical protein IPM18_13280 [Phycisphaerales bacterium]|nr:hypothetical protein [Phycisphaerales bacterium]
MFARKPLMRSWCAASCIVALLTVAVASGQILNENFNSATGTGGGTFFTGSGFGLLSGWDNGIFGESAFAGTTGNARIGFAAASGSPTAGLSGTGAGVIEVGGVEYDLLRQAFNTVTGTGGGIFLAGGAGPDTFNFVSNWDDGISGEIAFGGTFGSAVLNGHMSAAGLPGGGIGGSGGAVLDVDGVTLNTGGWYAGLQFDLGALPGSVVLRNAGFEEASAWVAFGNAYEAPAPIEVPPRSGAAAAKMFGAFPGPSGLFQDLPTQPGQTVTFSAFAYAPSFDPIAATGNQAQLRIEWRDATAANVLSIVQIVVLDPAAPEFVQDTWVQGTLSATAPAGAAVARVLLWFDQPAFAGGAVWWDDASVQTSGPGATDLSQFALTATARGSVNAVGEVLGGIQLRIEDPAGNRLYADVPATGSFQAIGGPLNTLLETDANGTPAPGAFNRNASYYRVVVAFSDIQLWGTGGTIELDDLLLSNTNPAGSAWYAGLFFDDLQIPTLNPNAFQILDPNMLILVADIKGDAAYPYALRLEGIRAVASALDEDFNTVVGDCGSGNASDCLIYDPATGGPGYTLNIDSGIEGEAAFAGVAQPVFPFLDAGISVSGDPTGGIDGNGGLKLEVRGLAPGVGGTWYAGIDYGGLALASSDLSQVTLTADIRGRQGAFGGLGYYELRIEDAEGDRLAFQMLATGNWQQVGGTLATAVELPPANGTPGNGFDTDSASYHVVIAFVDAPPLMPLATTWVSDGILEIDNLYLTPATQAVEVGRFEFLEPGNTQFKTVGGFITSADVQTLDLAGAAAGLTVIDFEHGTPGASGPMTGPWDPALPNEFTFSGGVTSSLIETCASCGVGGSQAARLVVTQTTNSWWAGMFFQAVPMDLSAGAGDNLAALADRELSALLNAAGTTLPYGVVELRVEDAQTDSLYFRLVANGSWQSIGGPLSGATRGFADPGQTNGSFDYFQPTYNITVAFTNFTTPTWGSPINLVIDNMAYTASGTVVTIPDSFTVTATFAEETSTWNTGGQLTVDNVLLALVPNCNGDLSLDLRDFALVQACFAGSGVPVAPECACGDLDGDGDVDAADGILNAIRIVPPLLVLPE